MWRRVASRGANLRRMSNANEDTEDTRLTRGVVGSVMAESRRAVSTQQEAGASPSAPADEDSDDESSSIKSRATSVLLSIVSPWSW